MDPNSPPLDVKQSMYCMKDVTGTIYLSCVIYYLPHKLIYFWKIICAIQRQSKNFTFKELSAVSSAICSSET